MFFLPIFQNYRNWVSKATCQENLKKNVKNAQNIFSAEYATPIRDNEAKKGQMVHISQKFLII